MTTQHDDFAKTLRATLMDIEKILLDKNRKYGNAVLEPKRIFSKANTIEQIKVRLDDKLSRIMSGAQDEDEDVEFDLIGYLLFLRIARHKLLDSQTNEE